jgi:hypothetical protein
MRTRKRRKASLGASCSRISSGTVGAVLGGLVGGAVGFIISKIQQADSAMPSVLAGIGIGVVGIGGFTALTSSCPDIPKEPYIFDERGNIKPWPKHLKVKAE